MNRIYHHYERWECVPAGMYDTTPTQGRTPDMCRAMYAKFLSDVPAFERALDSVLCDWPTSCEQFLSNQASNRIAWLGQASMCFASGVSSFFRAGFCLLDGRAQIDANATAHKWLNRWLASRAGESFALERAEVGTDQHIQHAPCYTDSSRRVAEYIESWRSRGYPQGIPDEVPAGLMRLCLAPSYKAVAICLLQNDLYLHGLGYSTPKSAWYGALKRIEISTRNGNEQGQMELF